MQNLKLQILESHYIFFTKIMYVSQCVFIMCNFTDLEVCIAQTYNNVFIGYLWFNSLTLLTMHKKIFSIHAVLDMLRTKRNIVSGTFWPVQNVFHKIWVPSFTNLPSPVKVYNCNGMFSIILSNEDIVPTCMRLHGTCYSHEAFLFFAALEWDFSLATECVLFSSL